MTESMYLQVLIANTLVAVKIRKRDPLKAVLCELEEEEHPVVTECLERYKPARLTFYRLNPAPETSSFEYADEYIVTNVPFILAGCQKIPLRKTTSAKREFSHPDTDVVSLYIETPSGEF